MRRSVIRVVVVAIFAVVGAGSGRAADVLTQHNDNARTGANTAETQLNTSTVAADKFGKLWTLYTDGQVVAQPLYVSKLPVDKPPVTGTFNAVIVATMHNTVYAYDADKENPQPNGQNSPLWATWLGPPRAGDKQSIDMWSTNDPEWGIAATPVIDPGKTTLWVTSWNQLPGKAPSYWLHALDLKNGAEKLPAVQIGGPPPNPQKPCEYPSGFNPCSEKQRAGLLLAGGVVYVGFGGTDNKPDHIEPGKIYPRGNLFAFDAATLRELAHWTSTPSGINGGVWGSGQGPAADADGNIYVITGNGTFTANNGGDDYGNSFVKLKLENGAFALKSWFTPCNQGWLDDLDLDLGSAGAMLLPNTAFVVGGGKEGVLYLLSRAALGGFAAAGGPGCANPNVVQAFTATGFHDHGGGTMYGHIHSAPVYWKGPDGARIYVWGENERLKAYPFTAGKFTVPNPRASIYQPPMGMPGGMLSVSSNGSRARSGIVWAVVPLNGDANAFRGVQGVLVALDAQDVSRQLWTSELGGVRDRLGLFAKFVPPTIAGGKVFVATYGDSEALHRYGANEHPAQFPAKYYVAVYGQLPAGHVHPAGTVVNQVQDDVAVTAAVATTALALDPHTCVAADAGNVDCTLALSRKAGAPAFHTVIVPANYSFAGCNLLTVTTVSKQAALASSTGIGWYAADATTGDQSMTNGRFVPTSEIKQLGNNVVHLKAGGDGVLQQFVGVANCTVGTGSYDKLFKPYMQFETSGDGTIFHNWDRAQNYRISRTVNRFDRSGDVLVP